MAFSDIAYKALQDIVGDENVSNDPAICQAYSRVQWLPSGVMQRERCGLNMRPACVVMPGSTAEVQAIVKVANRYRFPFIPRGSGFTFSAFPLQAGTIVIDPKRMGSIVELNEKDMYAVIEPYVSFVGLQAEAMKYGLYVPTPLAGSQVSCLANYAWHGAYGNSWITGIGAQNLLGFELVLPDGEVVRSGSMACPGAGSFWNDGPGPDLRGFLRGGMFGHAGGMGVVTRIACKLWQWAGPEVFPTEGNANLKFSGSLGENWRWHMIKFPFKYPEEEEKELRASAELFYEMGKAEIAEVATHLAQQFLYTYSSVTKQDLYDNIKNDVFPCGYCVVGLHAKTSPAQLEYEEKVLKSIVKKVGGIFVEEDEPAYQVWIKRAANEWIRFGNAQRLARPSDNFSIGSSNVDSVDQIVYEILESNEVGRRLLEEEGLGKDFVQPLSVHGGWISPQEYSYWCLHTTDVFPEQAVDQCNQALEIIGRVTKSQFERESASKAIHILGPAYDMFGPMVSNIHLHVKALKREFDPNNISNPGYATTPDVLSDDDWKKMMAKL
ncbi:MAG: FAD-binding oxidoreductase [Deltaproteobacteria bacterium]|nr:FAD-binding oxidoreductase [Deltaproteobacteria bacterium]